MIKRIVYVEGWNEELAEYYLDTDRGRRDFPTMSHDMHGWDGMQLGRDIIDTFAGALGLPIDIEQKEEEEEE